VITAADGVTALRLAADSRPDVIVLDLGLPDLDGVEVIAGIRGWTQIPIVVLSARAGSTDKVNALDAGADDYVTKPFGMAELLARIRAALRRATTPTTGADPLITTASFKVDLAAKTVVRADCEIHLTPTEWHILEKLARNQGKLVGQRQLLHEIWGEGHEEQTHYLRVYLAQLRRKLEPDPARPRHLITEPGMGYRFVP
jgi:two-component system KDP operon response regulator KdpE